MTLCPCDKLPPCTTTFDRLLSSLCAEHYRCLRQAKESGSVMIGKCGRAVEGVGLENQSGESHRGFESLRFLQRTGAGVVKRRGLQIRCDVGSNPTLYSTLRGISSSGRASALHAEGDRFDSDILHQRGRSSVVERLVYTQDVVGSIPSVPTRRHSDG